MKQSTAAMVGLLAWAFTGLARAQQAPPEPVPADQPQPPPAPPLPTPSTPSTEPPKPGSALAPPPVGAEVTPPAPAPAANPATPPTSEAKPVEKTTSKTPLLGLALGTPDTGTLPGRFRPSYGIAPVSASDYRFDFHGYLMVPFRVATNTRAHAYTTQHTTTFHAPPLVPDDFDRFEHTGVLAQPWVQLGFSYGNSRAAGTIVIAARTVSNGSGFFNPPNQLGINDAFLTFKPDFKPVYVEINVGGFANRYGAMGDYDTGRYDTPVIARIGGVGETIRADIPLVPGITVLAEQGITTQLDKAPLGVEPAGWNDFADPNVGSSFAHHEHVGISLARRLQFGVHYINAFSRDDRTAPTTPNGTIEVLGADLRAELAPFGRLYLAAAQTNADKAASVSGVIRVLNTQGGRGLIQNYFGPTSNGIPSASNGTGKLTTLGGQYDVSIGEIVRNPAPYSGYGPDLFASVFGMFTRVSSDVPEFDGVSKVKYGAEVTYSALPWLALSTRYDRVVADTDDARQTFSVLSPRIILRSDFNSQDQVTLQYSRWFYGSGVVVRGGYPPVNDPTIVPDENMLSLTANLWW